MLGSKTQKVKSLMAEVENMADEIQKLQIEGERSSGEIKEKTDEVNSHIEEISILKMKVKEKDVVISNLRSGDFKLEREIQYKHNVVPLKEDTQYINVGVVDGLSNKTSR